MDWKLLVIRQQSKIASLAIYEDVYKIDRVTAISLSDADTRQIDLEVSIRFSLCVLCKHLLTLVLMKHFTYFYC